MNALLANAAMNALLANATIQSAIKSFLYLPVLMVD